MPKSRLTQEDKQKRIIKTLNKDFQKNLIHFMTRTKYKTGIL